MKIAVASGKGGTGKTTIAVSLALSLGDVQYLDCDVEEPNGHLFLKPQIKETISVGIPVPEIDTSRCTYCGLCAKVCVYHALVVIKDMVLTFPELCHGCGACSSLCPENAIVENDRTIGVIEKGIARDLEFIHARLNIGEPMAPPLIRKEKQYLNDHKTALLDCPPGTSCPVVQSAIGSDFCLLVTEPTPFGLHDLKLAVEMVRALKIPCGVVINMADVGTRETWDFCRQEHLPILMEIPFDRRIAESYARGIPLVDAFPEYRDRFCRLYQAIAEWRRS
ncbi:MAG TPA: ATP-binding protein [Thermodesulfobacteriota bacterium]|nr:ATP-binding protein [Thermodesulfobacteriota bacterium]HNU70312.1 ATP-binding protein [Thermodesulfobacteriota bacterium]